MARYRGSHFDCRCDDGAGAIWFTIDKEEVIRFSDLTFLNHLEDHVAIRCKELGVSKNDCFWNKDIMASIVAKLSESGILACDKCLDIMVAFGETQIETALNSNNVLLSLLAILDKRTTENQLDMLDEQLKNDSPLQRFLLLRIKGNSESISRR